MGANMMAISNILVGNLILLILGFPGGYSLSRWFDFAGVIAEDGSGDAQFSGQSGSV